MRLPQRSFWSERHASVFVRTGYLNSDARLNAFSDGAVLIGWIGALLGAVLIIINTNTQDLDALGTAIALMSLTLLYA